MYLYNDEEEMIELINSALWGTLETPRKLKCQRGMKDFYKNLIEIVGGVPK